MCAQPALIPTDKHIRLFVDIFSINNQNVKMIHRYTVLLAMPRSLATLPITVSLPRCMTTLIKLCLTDLHWGNCGSSFPRLPTKPQTSGISFHTCVSVRQGNKHMLMAMDTCEYFTMGPLSHSHTHTHSAQTTSVSVIVVVRDRKSVV